MLLHTVQFSYDMKRGMYINYSTIHSIASLHTILGLSKDWDTHSDLVVSLLVLVFSALELVMCVAYISCNVLRDYTHD